VRTIVHAASATHASGQIQDSFTANLAFANPWSNGDAVRRQAKIALRPSRGPRRRIRRVSPVRAQ
jgi:hypothetical protein